MSEKYPEIGNNHILASTVSVDEYFDELIEQVLEDYANL